MNTMTPNSIGGFYFILCLIILFIGILNLLIRKNPMYMDFLNIIYKKDESITVSILQKEIIKTLNGIIILSILSLLVISLLLFLIWLLIVS
ncbi:hypothetical protein AZF37_00265 [endosymbiont 'TC1' of Trimyema compressum]|nr:hypothetical protein AZF37_00265 [endosymbiont 'TC1' of Trimyema compressum]